MEEKIDPILDPILPFPLTTEIVYALTKGGFIVAGKATLAAGTITIDNNKIKKSSFAIAAYFTPSGTLGTHLKAITGDQSLVITSIDTAGATVTTDTSVIQYLIILAANI